MSKKQRRYQSIDKKYLTEGDTVDFDIYVANEERTAMSIFLQAGSIIRGDDKIRLRELEKVFIDDSESVSYHDYLQRHIQYIAEHSEVPTERKAAIVYQKAAETIESMFKNPESLANVEASEELVGEFIDIILHDDFAVESLMKITAHDYYTHTHSINVSIYTLALGEFIGLKGQDLEDLGVSSLLHDLGKSKVDARIINKNGKLTDAEFSEMKKHPALGHRIAIEMGITDRRILSGIRHHHEKMDGNGYPDHIKADKITLFARIIGVCDVFDALSTKRSYKDPMSSFESLALMKKQMSTHLDMKLVNAFIKMIRQSNESSKEGQK